MSSSDSSSASSSSSASDVLKTVKFAQPDKSSQLLDNAVTASDLLLAAYDPAKLHPLAELGDKLDYLLLDDDKTSDLPGADTAIPSRGWSDDLCYGTGTMYLTGMFSSFKLLLSSTCARLYSLFFLPISHLISTSQTRIFSLLLFYFVTCSLRFYRPNPWRCMGSTGRRPSTSCSQQYQAAG